MTSIDGGIQFAVVALDNELFKATPVPDDGEQIIFSAPAAPNCRVEVLSVDIAWAIAPVDASNVITGDLVFHDASGNTDTVLADDVDFEGVDTAYEGRSIWVGNQSLDPGDTLRLEWTITTPDTAGLGGAVIVGYRVKQWNGQ
jgi:hypothetical protein